MTGYESLPLGNTDTNTESLSPLEAQVALQPPGPFPAAKLSVLEAKQRLLSQSAQDKRISSLTVLEAKRELLGRVSQEKQTALNGGEVGPSLYGIEYKYLSPENKVLAHKTAVEERQRALALTQEEALQDKEAFMSSASADTLVGGTINLIGGKTIKGGGNLVKTFANLPRDIQATYTATRDFLSNLAKEHIPGYEEAVTQAQDTGVSQVVGAAGTGISKLTTGTAALGGEVEAFTDKFSNDTKTNKFMHELGKDFESAEGFWDGAGKMIATAVVNPVASAEIFAESLPQMYALAAKGTKGAITFLALTNQNVEEATKGFKEAHGGRAPDAKETSLILAASIAAVAVDKVQAGFLLKPIDPGTKLGAATEAVRQAVARATNAKITNLPGINTSIKALVSAPAEAGQEAFQTGITELAATQDIKSLEDPEFQKKVAVAAGAGLGAGAVGGGSVQAVADTVKVAKIAKTGVDIAAEKASDKIGSVLDQNVTNLSDPTNKKYNPGKAAKIIASEGIETATTVEEVSAYADKVTTLTNAQAVLLDKDLATDKISQANYDIAQDKLYELNSQARQAAELRIEALAERGPTTADEATAEETGTQETETGASLEDTTTDIKESTIPAQAEKLTAELKDSKRELTTQEKAVMQTTFNSMQESSEGVSIEVAKRITEDKLNNYTEKEKELAKLHIEKNALLHVDPITGKSTDEVVNSVIVGKEGFIGVDQYQRNISATIQDGNHPKAKEWLTRFQEFAKDHANKRKAFLAAKAKYTAAGDHKKVPLDGYPRYYYNGNDRIIDNITAESKLINKVYKSLLNNYVETFKDSATVKPITEVAEDTTKVDEAPATPEAEVTEPTVTETVKAVKVAATPEPTISTKPVQPKLAPKQASTLTADPKVKEYFRIKLRDVYKQLTSEEQEAAKNVAGQLRKVTDKTTRKQLKAITNRIENLVQRAANNKVIQETVAEPIVVEEGPKTFDSPTTTLQEDLKDTSYAWKGTKRFTNLFEPTRTPVKNVLHTISDFFEKLGNSEYTGELNEEQRSILPSIAAFNEKFTKTLVGDKDSKALLAFLSGLKIRDDTKAQDAIYLLIKEDANGNRTLNPNLISLMAMAGYNWLGTRAKKTLFNDKRAINAILGRDPEHEVTPQEYAKFFYVGTTRRVVAESLGADVYKSLGIKLTAAENIDGELSDKLIMAFGNIIQGVLLDQGYLYNNVLEASDFEGLEGVETIAEEKSRNFIQATNLNAENPFQPSEDIQKIIDSMKESDNALTELFGLDNYITGPVFEASKFIPSKMKGSVQNVPDRAIKKLKRALTVKWKLKLEAVQLFDTLGPEWLMDIEGYVPDVDNNVHIDDRDNVTGKNLSIARDVEHLTQFIKDVGVNRSRPFYFNYEFWKNLRIGLVSNTLNPQGSKIHRHFIHAERWKVNVNTAEIRQQFKFAIVQSFGGSIDNDTREVSNAAFDNIIAQIEDKDSVLGKGIQAIKTLYDKDTDIEQAKLDIAAAVKQGGEKSHSLDGLLALANYHPTEDFETTIGLETDGKTSGVIIGLLQSALEYDIIPMVNAGGMMTNPADNSFAEFASRPENKDLYKQLAAKWHKVLHLGKVPKNFPFIAQLVGDLVMEEEVTSLGRDLSKSPLMITNYGAAIKKVQEALGYKVLRAYRDTLTSLDPNDDTDRIKIKAHLRIMQSLLGPGSQFKIPRKGPNAKKALLEMSLDKKQETLLLEAINTTYGEALGKAIENTFSEFIDFRRNMNGALKIMFVAFKGVYDAQVRTDTKKKNGYALSKEEKLAIVEKYRNLLPTFQSALSDGVDDSILVMNEDKHPDYTKPGQQTSFTRKVGNAKNSLTNRYSESTYTDGGVSGTVLGIHSIDGNTILDIMAEYDVLGVHDATFAALDQVVEVAGGYNKTFLAVNREFSLYASVHESFLRSQAALKDLSPTLFAKLNRKIATDPLFRKDALFRGPYDKTAHAYNLPIMSVEEFLIPFEAMAGRIDKAREDLFNAIHHSNQMPHDKAEYTVIKSPTSFDEELAAEDNAGHIQNMIEIILNSADELDTDNFIPDSESTITSANLKAEFDLLGKEGIVKESPSHAKYLQGILDDLVAKVISPVDTIELKLREEGNTTLGAIQGNTVFIQSSNIDPKNNVQMSAQEVLVHELMHAITRFGLNDADNYFLRKELERVYQQAKRTVRWQDFLTRDEKGQIIYQVNEYEEVKAAKERYNYVFRNNQVSTYTVIDPRTGKEAKHTNAAYLHEFLAYAMTNKQMMEALAKPMYREKTTLRGETILDTLVNILTRILDWIAGKLYNTNDVHLDEAVYSLVQQIAGIESKNKNALVTTLNKVSRHYAKATQGLREYVLQPMVDFTVKLEARPTAVGRTVKLVKGIPEVYKSAELGKAVIKSLERLKQSEEGLFVSIIREMQGSKSDNIRWHTLLRESKKFIDQGRKDIATNVTDQILKSFSVELSKTDRIAINRALLKTDLTVLFESYTPTEIANLLRNHTALETAIRTTEAKLSVFGINGSYYMNQADSLGHYMAQGTATVDEAHMNAYSIAQLLGVIGVNLGTTEVTPIGDLGKAEEIIDELATLRALSYTANANKDILANIIDREYAANPNDNGIVMSLALQNGFKKDSLKRLFNNNKTQTVKGYTSEIVNPHIGIKFGTAKDIDAMAADGYVKTDALSRDSIHAQVANNKEPIYMFVSRSGGNATQMKFIASQTNTTMKGSDFVTFADNLESTNPIGEANLDRLLVQVKKQQVLKYQFRGKNVTDINETYVIPVRNEHGKTVGYRYTMSEYNKVDLLQKNDDFAQIMGKMYGSIVDKTETKRINRKVVEMAYLDYKEGYAANPTAFVELSKESAEKYAEIYALMPDGMHRDIKEVWGKKPMMVRRELIPLIFGYRKMSLANLELPAGRKQVIDADGNISYVPRTLKLKGKTKEYVQVAESIWQDVVKTAKDFIVIKSVIVPAANVASNMLLLKIAGVPLGDILKQKVIAMAALNNYSADHSAREQLQRKLDTYKDLTDVSKSNLQRKINELDDKISNNPVKHLVDEGIFQSIIEDVETEGDDYSYKSTFTDTISELAERKVHPNLIKVYKYGFITKDTPVYKAMYRFTQYSDFVARYTMYNHLTKVKKVGEQTALKQVIEAFVNYDLPTHKIIQYGNDMGLIMFTKFLFRIQKVIFGQMADHPAEFFTLLTMQSLLGIDAPDISDSFGPMPMVVGPFSVIDSATTYGGVNIAEGIIDPLID